ncbi:MAG: TIGR03087 family PEP-CTERM/XrtA system glycosyltransferase [Salinisphaera sp.]|jgi:sugar transferase (PEP-CTERM/EpsH1 system associated)|nr:TIGR03087 family PEP-CTERM/XrtA system glycosyltransferase [Salinisphaera sp.]
MGELLFLCHRIPYPPNKGDKIRAYHWLKALSAHYTVHLATFVDDPEDWAGCEALSALCDQQYYRPLKPLTARLRSADGLRRREALSFAYYRDRQMAAWVDDLLATRPIEAVIAFSSTMAPYVVDAPQVRRILDFVDVDSDKWAQYAQATRGPMRWVYAREARRLAEGERQLAEVFDASIFVSEAEASFFRAQAPRAADRVHAIGNGVDADYFDAAGEYDNPFAESTGPQIVFTGAMDYGANVDAVCWFAEHVMPDILAARPDARFTIVGIRPTPRVRALAAQPGIHVTGAVPDVRPYLAHAGVVVAPMRIARGIQNKVLEGLAMGRHVVMTEQAAAGLETTDARFARLVNEPGPFAEAVIACFDDPASHADGARDYVLRHYAWQARFDELLALTAGHPPACAPRTRIQA